MDIQKIVNEKVEEIISSGEIVKRIEDDIEKSIIAAIDSKLSGYSFKNDLEKQLSESIDPALKGIDLSVYGELVKQRFQNIVNQVLDNDLSEKVDKFYSDLFTSSKEPIKLSEFLEVVKESYREDNEYSGSYYLSIEFNDEHNWWEIGFQEDEPYSKSYHHTCDNSITLSERSGKDNNNYWLLSVSIDKCGFSLSDKKISHIGSTSKAERMLLNAYFNNVDIIMDVESADEVETEWYND